MPALSGTMPFRRSILEGISICDWKRVTMRGIEFAKMIALILLKFRKRKSHVFKCNESEGNFLVPILIKNYPITPLKGAAPLSGSIKDFTIFWKIKSSKKGACALFFSLYF